MKRTANRFLKLPGTRLGWRSVWLELAFVLMFIINIFVNLYVVRPIAPRNEAVLPYYIFFVVFMLLSGLAGGVLGLAAVTRRQERSLLVWLAILFGLFVLLLVLNEFLQGIRYWTGM